VAGWSKKKRKRVEGDFYTFLNSCHIFSKDHPKPICLGEELYDGQRRFITAVFDALEDDIHDIYCLKSRQLGISTIVRALIVFFQGLLDGSLGAIVFDTDFNKVRARAELVKMIKALPMDLEFPAVEGDNRYGLTLSNSSETLFMSAGVKQSKGSGVLGRSVGISLAALSEICSYDNEEGLEAFENSLSDVNPDRLYIWESTARGFNAWHTRWVKARADIHHKRCIFLGWWSKPSQMIPKTHPDFERYGMAPPTDVEVKKIKAVNDLYGHQITVEQLAWIRRRMDPAALTSVDAKADIEGDTLKLQEQPWTEDDAFQMTGSVFFRAEKLTDQVNSNVSAAFKSFMFGTGIEFVDMRVYPAPNVRSTELKVWEEPEADSVYVVSADVAYGLSSGNDRSSVQVLRCYADGLDQVAEYAYPLIGTKQFAWVTLALAGWYAGESSEVYLIVEQNGPGVAVWDEINHLKTHLPLGYQPQAVAERGLGNIFKNVRTYVNIRPDSMSAQKTWNWTTSAKGVNSKVRLMERCRDFTENGMFRIRSLAAVDEMRSVTRDGDSIGAAGSKKDDRVMSCALGIRCWEDRVRRLMSARNRTREAELAKRKMTVIDLARVYNANQFQAFLGAKGAVREQDRRALSRHNWRHRGRF